MGSFIVTGGLGRLGRAVVEVLAGEGHRVAVVDLAEGADDLDLVIGGVDLADEAAVAEAFARAAALLGAVDGLVNIAGGFTWAKVAGSPAETFDRMYRMNLRTAAVASNAVLAHLRDGGAIVNIGAASAAQPGIGVAAYAASKAGVAALTVSLAEELRGRRIRVNAVLPTILDTPANRADMPDADPGTWVSPAAAGRVIAFLLSDAAGAITGASIPLSMGQGG
jgi:NAD(P)-dependent dehydrogenase (short-subunit alcohol dehydrogenase family)